MSKDLLAYRIPNDSSIEELGTFKVMKNDVQKSTVFVVSNFYDTKQLVFEPNGKAQFDPLDYALHFE